MQRNYYIMNGLVIFRFQIEGLKRDVEMRA